MSLILIALAVFFIVNIDISRGKLWSNPLSIYQTRSINGIAVMLIFLSNATQYLSWGDWMMPFYHFVI